MFLCALAALSQERPGQIMSGAAGMTRNGVQVRIKYNTVAEPPLKNPADLKISGGVAVMKDLIHRDMNDTVNKQSFGYDLTAEPGPGPDQLTVTIAPLSMKSEYALVPLPKYPPPQVVQDGDTIALDLLVSPDGSRKIVDYIQVSTFKEPAAASSTAAAKDYTPDDGPLNFGFFDAKILVNGVPFTGVSGFTGKAGATLWMSVPNQGRYILSLVPSDGLQKAGVIRDNVISFESEGQKYEIRTQNLILGTKGAWNLYAAHDPLYQPKPGTENYISLGTDRLDNLMKR
jgi:hypothetical protein